MQNMEIKLKQKGFTLIELIIVIAIICILAAVAIPKYMSLKTEASQASLEGYAGALSSASAVNHASCQTDKGHCIEVKNCKDLSKLLSSAMPNTITLVDKSLATDGNSGTCSLVDSKTELTKTFEVLGAKRS